MANIPKVSDLSGPLDLFYKFKNEKGSRLMRDVTLDGMVMIVC